jgi:DNA repair protein RadD
MSGLLAEAATGYTLRSYQQHAIARSLKYLTDEQFRGRNGLIVAPTGSGKSLIIAGIATALDGPCIVFQPSKEILAQNAEKLRGYGYYPAIYSASFNRRSVGTITLATIGSVIRHTSAFRDVRYVLIDECHLVNAKGGMYREFLDALQHARTIGLTATPYRLTSNSMGSEIRFLTRTRPRVFHDVVQYTNLAPLFKAGFLSPLVYHTPEVVDLTRIRLNSTGADYDDASLRQHFSEIGFGSRLHATVTHLLASGHRGILVFTRFVEESAALAAQIPGAAVVTADTPDDERAQILWKFKKGLIRVVANVGVLTVGFDYPELTTVVLARPTMSLALYYQMVGRCVRPHPSKPAAHVVDLVGLVRRFGKLEDLHMHQGGARGDQWVIRSGTRPLTNVCFGQPRGFVKPQPSAKDLA